MLSKRGKWWLDLQGSLAFLLALAIGAGSKSADTPAHCSAQAPNAKQPNSSFHFGSLHDVVGHDGVLVISLLRTQVRFDMTAERLKSAGIWPTEFAAADVQCLAQQELDKGCLHAGAENAGQQCEGRTGEGCSYVNEQAVSESHRRALVAALERSNEWTAILEDDVMPVRPDRWNAAFKRAWKSVPDHVKVVRLSWCHFPDDNPGLTVAHDSFRDSGEFHLQNWTGYDPGHHYNPGLCSSAYMVHQDIIPEMLKLFPCCCAVDCCYLYDFFAKGWEKGEPRGLQFMMQLDAWGSTDYAEGYHLPWVRQSGVLIQDAREVPSTQEWMDTIESVDNPVLKK